MSLGGRGGRKRKVALIDKGDASVAGVDGWGWRSRRTRIYLYPYFYIVTVYEVEQLILSFSLKQCDSFFDRATSNAPTQLLSTVHHSCTTYLSSGMTTLCFLPLPLIFHLLSTFSPLLLLPPPLLFLALLLRQILQMRLLHKPQNLHPLLNVILVIHLQPTQEHEIIHPTPRFQKLVV